MDEGQGVVDLAVPEADSALRGPGLGPVRQGLAAIGGDHQDELASPQTGDGAEGEQGRLDADADVAEVGVGEHGTRCRRGDEGDDDGAVVQVSLHDMRQDTHLQGIDAHRDRVASHDTHIAGGDVA